MRKTFRSSPKARYDRARFYVIEGKELPSVTTILDVIDKPALKFWYANQERAAFQVAMNQVLRKKNLNRAKLITAVLETVKGIKAGERAKRESSDVGRDLHAAIEWTLKREMKEKCEKPEISAQAAEMYRRWLKWWKNSGLTPLAVEQTIYSMKHGYAGTMDLYAKIGNLKLVLDWKTSSAVYPESYLQNIAYRTACSELGLPSIAGVIVRIPKDGGNVEAKRVPQEVVVEDFLAALRLWRWHRRMDGLKVGGK